MGFYRFLKAGETLAIFLAIQYVSDSSAYAKFMRVSPALTHR